MDKTTVSDFLSLGAVTLFEPKRLIGLGHHTVFTLTLNLSSRKKEYHRKVYSIFDWISSTGGLLDVIERFFALVVLFFSSRMFQIHIVQNMFYAESETTVALNSEEKLIGVEHPKVEITLCELLMYQLCVRPCTRCGCSSKWKLARKARLFEMGAKKLEQAIDVEQIRKQQLMIKDLKYLLLDDPYLRKLLKI